MTSRAIVDRALAPLRLRGMRIIGVFIWLNIIAIVPIGIFAGTTDTFLVLALGLINGALPSWIIWKKREDPQSRTILCLALILFPMLFLYQFRGIEWQMEMHMYFFVCFSLMVLLCDARPIIAAAALTIAQHVSLSLVAPEWIFPYSGGMSRMLFHGVLVSCEAAILMAAIRQITEQALETRRAQDEADGALAMAEEARIQAEAARLDAEQALEAARIAEKRVEVENANRLAAEAALKLASDRRRHLTADEIEANVGALIADLGSVAEEFNNQAYDITSVSGLLADEATALRRSSQAAVTSITDMARNSEELAGSIRLVGQNAYQAQSVATDTASTIANLGPSIVALSEEVNAARSILQQVSAIANQSNLLALNASIEAARSGEAGLSFAVVAAEMKQMALATSRAADDIAHKLSSIVGAADAFRVQINQATSRVDEITGSSCAITSAVEQQRGATEAIARGADSVLGKVSETDSRSHHLHEAAGRNRAIADCTIELADRLHRRARELNARMAGLLAELRAA
jgi:methyl-accepting chemotaxis protein